MTFLIPTPEQAHAGLRAMKTALTAEGPLAAIRREALVAIQRHLLRTDHDLDALTPIEPDELAAAIDDPALRNQLVSGMVTLVLTREAVVAGEVAAVERFAAALAVSPSALANLRRFHTERLLALRIDVARRSLAGPGLRQLYEAQGVLGVVKNLASFAGLWENHAVAERYRGLADYADGTLGKELWRFYTANDLRLPGEKRGGAEPLVTHDLSHILAGHGTDYTSEGLVLAFQAGYKRQEPFSVLVFLLLNGQQGLRLTPLAEPAHGYYNDKPGAIDDIVRAFARGARMTVDLTDHWDFWAVMDRPVEALRREYGIEPWAA